MGKENMREQSKDELSLAILMFVISASVMITATSVLFNEDQTLTKVFDMV